MFRVKICGITTPSDAIAARDAGADALGLNFYPVSPRCVAIEQAREIRQALTGSPVELIGLFVNSELGVMIQAARQLDVTSIQLHGDEPVEWIEELAPWPVIRAIRVRDGESLSAAVDRALGDRVPTNLRALLIDAQCDGLYGGSGKTVVRSSLGQLVGSWRRVPWILAGGLTPANVGRAIREARPDAVDTASGVELAAGRKDASAMRTFVAEARAAFASLDDPCQERPGHDPRHPTSRDSDQP